MLMLSGLVVVQGCQIYLDRDIDSKWTRTYSATFSSSLGGASDTEDFDSSAGGGGVETGDCSRLLGKKRVRIDRIAVTIEPIK